MITARMPPTTPPMMGPVPREPPDDAADCLEVVTCATVVGVEVVDVGVLAVVMVEPVLAVVEPVLAVVEPVLAVVEPVLAVVEPVDEEPVVVDEEPEPWVVDVVVAEDEPWDDVDAVVAAVVVDRPQEEARVVAEVDEKYMKAFVSNVMKLLDPNVMLAMVTVKLVRRFTS